MIKQNKYTTSLMDYFVLHNSIVVPKTGNFGLPRNQMPQIDSKYMQELSIFLKRQGVRVTKAKLATKSLMLVQNEYNRAKVATLIDRMRNHPTKAEPIIVSNDGFVIDGSHRFLATYNIDHDSLIDAYVIYLPALDCIQLLNTFPQARHRNFSDKNV